MAYRFLPDRIHRTLISNGCLQLDQVDELYPPLKLFAPDDTGIWLIVKVMKHNPNIGYGLIDIGQGNPHQGYIDLQLLGGVRGKMGLPIERDVDFVAKYPQWVYVTASTFDGKYTENETILSGVFALKTISPTIVYPKPSLN
ncbi:DUF2958 domain-containing protein [Chryseolinea sp. H1M3-3]|uniref:DUF2958 domain-containing protein n=1 Tax=Chryseolinea sp. H1M3-3 TaxID=3034144 RepID=UPI0023EC6BDE|nr:DUF2958 domain-containing protein [Chryseolinea sp. H1M3-3]